MSAIGITMVRNEEDVIEHVVRHMLVQVDQVVVADNLSTDQTREILDGINDERLVVVDDDDPAYRQSEKMTALAEMFAYAGDWVVPFDADELWNAPVEQRLSDWLYTYDESVAAGRPWVHVPTLPRKLIDCPFEGMPQRMTVQETWPKAALRWESGMTIEQGNHWTTSAVPDVLDIRHFQYRSLEHFRRKVTQGTQALELADLPADSGAHWRYYASLPERALTEWWHEYTNQPLVFDTPMCRMCLS